MNTFEYTFEKPGQDIKQMYYQMTFKQTNIRRDNNHGQH